MGGPSAGRTRRRSPFAAVFWGTAFAFLGYCFFHDWDGLEKGLRDPESVPALFAFLYRLGGKWFAAGTIMLLGGLIVWSGVRDFIRSRTSKPSQAFDPLA